MASVSWKYICVKRGYKTTKKATCSKFFHEHRLQSGVVNKWYR